MTVELVTRLTASRVAVIGDIMIDVYLQGEVSRISPEAPVPVVRWKSERLVPGGAANVLANIVSLGASASLVGIVGADDGLGRLKKLLGDFECADLAGVVIDPGRLTTRKTRLLGQQQQIVRIDQEDMHAIEENIENKLIENAFAAVDGNDIVILSDYGKGVLSERCIREIITYTTNAGKKVIVDPKRSDLSAYRGATILTPNRAELALATSLRCETDDEAEAAAKKAQSNCDADILLTRAEKGMSFFPRRGAPAHLPTVAREVFDVSGAGDTVVAVLATALASGNEIVDAMKIANHAAGIVVGKAGTATLTYAELAASLAVGIVDDVDGRIAELHEAQTLRWVWEKQGYTVGIANGCFDLLHPGHISLIRQAVKTCDRLILALNTDASVRRLKGPTRPVQSERARAEVIGAIKGVALVVLFDEDTPFELIAALQPDVLIKGADYAEKDVVGADVVRARGGKVVLAKLVDGQSTSRLIEGAK